MQQRPQIGFLLFRRGEHLQDFHVRHIGRMAVEHFRGPGQPAENFRHMGKFKIGQLGGG